MLSTGTRGSCTCKYAGGYVSVLITDLETTTRRNGLVPPARRSTNACKLLALAEGRLSGRGTWAADDWWEGKTVGRGVNRQEMERQGFTAGENGGGSSSSSSSDCGSCPDTDHHRNWVRPRWVNGATRRATATAQLSAELGEDKWGREGRKARRGSQTRLAGVSLLRRPPTSVSIFHLEL